MRPAMIVSLTSAIAKHLQSTQTTTAINMILGRYELSVQDVDIVPSKAQYVRGLLKDAPEAVIVRIAEDLGLDVPNKNSPAVSDFKKYLETGGLHACEDDFQRASKAIEADPDQAIASAGSLLESVFKVLLEKLAPGFPDTETLVNYLS